MVLNWTMLENSYYRIESLELIGRDNNDEGIVFRKSFNNQEIFGGGWKTSKFVLKKYSRNLEKIFFTPKFTILSYFFS